VFDSSLYATLHFGVPLHV